jgi:uncharacterized protein (TIGR01244 family)
MLVFLAASAVGALAAAAPGVGEIESFHAVTDRVAIGAQPTPEQVIALANAGFNGIITLREESELNDGPQSHAAVTSGVQFFRIPVSRENPSDAAVEKFLMVTDDENVYPLFIYCASGNRAAALWMIRRVLRDRWTVSDAEAEAARVGLTSATMRDFARDYIRRHPAH